MSLPMPATAPQGEPKPVGRQVVEGNKDVANGGVPENIPLMGEGEKEDDDSLIMPAEPNRRGREGSWPAVCLFFRSSESG